MISDSEQPATSHPSDTGADTPKYCREISPGVWWLGGCQVISSARGTLHSHLSAYLLMGQERSLLVDTGHPKDWPAINAYLDELLGDRDLDWIFPTHPEYPHAGNLAKLLEKYPKSVAIGDVRDYHLYLPGMEERFVGMQPTGTVSLGRDNDVIILPALIRDLPNTLWCYLPSARILFVSDGFGFSHGHMTGECDLFGSEMPTLPDRDETMFVIERTLSWAYYTDCSSIIRSVRSMMDEFVTDLIAPAHGNVIDDMDGLLTRLEAAMIDLGTTRTRESEGGT